MLIVNNIWIFAVVIIPLLIYSSIIYFRIPHSFVTKQRARRYFVAGLLSPALINLFYFLFPNWGVPQSETAFISYFVFAFLQVGFLEETTKYATFQWVSNERISENEDLPIATAFYAMMSAVGFALVENITYLIQIRQQILDAVPYASEAILNKAFGM